MALYDNNGKITIDEVAAEQDIKMLLKAQEYLAEANKYLQEITAISSDFSGNANTKIFETAQLLQGKIGVLDKRITECSNNIQNTVKKYQVIDENLKDTINSTINDD